MTNRRIDAIYFIALLAVALIGYQVSVWTEEDGGPSIDPSTFNPPSALLPEPLIDLPEPFFAFRSLGKYQSPAVPRRFFADEMEAALLDVRTSLLRNSVPKEAPKPGRLAGVFE